jgi:hypothetical protein
MSAFLDRVTIPADRVMGADCAKALMPGFDQMMADPCPLTEDGKPAAFQLLDSFVNDGICSPEALDELDWLVMTWAETV